MHFTFLVISIISIFLVLHFLPNIASSDTFPIETPQINLPKGLKARIGKGMIHDVIYLPDGTQFAVASSTGIWFYDANTYEETALIATDKPAAKMMSFSLDGEKLATISNNKVILIWDIETFKHKTTFIRDSEPYYDFDFDSVSFIGDGKSLVSTKSGKIDLWDVTTGTHHFELQAFHSADNIAFSTDGRILASSRSDVILVVDVVEEKVLQEMKINSHVDKCLALSSDGKTVASGIQYKTIEVWDIEKGEHKKTLKGHEKRIECLAFSPDGNTLASGSTDYSIILWDINKGTRKATLNEHSNEIRKVVFSPDGNTLLSFDRFGLLMLWDVNSRKQKYSLRDHVDIATSISLSPDGLTLVSGSTNGYIHLWDVTTAKHKKILRGHKSEVYAVSYSSDGLTIVSESMENTTRLWNAITGNNKKRAREITIRQWDAKTGKSKNRPSIHPKNMSKVVISPKTQLLAGVTEKNIHICELDTMQQKYAPITHESSTKIVRLSFSPDGKIIASTDGFKIINMWDVASGSHLRTLDLKHNSENINDLVFSPDGKSFASFRTYSKKINLWDVATGVHKHTLKDIFILLKDNGFLLSCEFSPDGKYLLAGSFDFTLSIWDADTGKLVKTIKGFSHRISGIAFSQDGKTLITSGDGAVLVWDFATLINGSN